MHTADTRAISGFPLASDFGASRNHARDFSGRTSGGGWEKGSGAVPEMSAVRLPDFLGRAIHEIGPIRPVNMDIYKARTDVSIARVNYGCGQAAGASCGDADDPVAGDLKDPATKYLFGKYDSTGERDAS
jgi:hypothetical protein